MSQEMDADKVHNTPLVVDVSTSDGQRIRLSCDDQIDMENALKAKLQELTSNSQTPVCPKFTVKDPLLEGSVDLHGMDSLNAACYLASLSAQKSRDALLKAPQGTMADLLSHPAAPPVSMGAMPQSCRKLSTVPEDGQKVAKWPLSGDSTRQGLPLDEHLRSNLPVPAQIAATMSFLLQDIWAPGTAARRPSGSELKAELRYLMAPAVGEHSAPPQGHLPGASVHPEGAVVHKLGQPGVRAISRNAMLRGEDGDPAGMFCSTPSAPRQMALLHALPSPPPAAGTRNADECVLVNQEDVEEALKMLDKPRSWVIRGEPEILEPFPFILPKQSTLQQMNTSGTLGSDAGPLSEISFTKATALFPTAAPMSPVAAPSKPLRRHYANFSAWVKSKFSGGQLLGQ